LSFELGEAERKIRERNSRRVCEGMWSDGVGNPKRVCDPLSSLCRKVEKETVGKYKLLTKCETVTRWLEKREKNRLNYGPKWVNCRWSDNKRRKCALEP
jgi:hypothetical protein